jgi:hypothetical protein
VDVRGQERPIEEKELGRFHITSYRLLDISLFDKHTKHSSTSTRRSQTVSYSPHFFFSFPQRKFFSFFLQGQKEENNRQILSNVESNICNNMKYEFGFFVCLFLLFKKKNKKWLERLFGLLFDFCVQSRWLLALRSLSDRQAIH